MPVYFTTPTALVNYVQEQIGPNGTEAITGQIHQDVLVSIIISMINIMATIPDQTVYDFPEWESSVTYPGGTEIIVRHNGKLYLFLKDTDSFNQVPGTTGLVWQEINAIQLAHFRNKDVYLAEGTADQCSAQELRRLLDSAKFWQAPVDALAADPGGAQPDGTVMIVDTPATGAFAGQENNVATMVNTFWVFTVPLEGEVRLLRSAGGAFAIFEGGAWQFLAIGGGSGSSSLEAALAVGSTTGAYNLTFNKPYIRTEVVVNHQATDPPPRDLDLTAASSFHVNVAGDIQLGHTGHLKSDYHIKIYNNVSCNIYWTPGKWSKDISVTLPATLTAGDFYFLHCVAGDGGFAGGGNGRLHILSITKAINV